MPPRCSHKPQPRPTPRPRRNRNDGRRKHPKEKKVVTCTYSHQKSHFPESPQSRAEATEVASCYYSNPAPEHQRDRIPPPHERLAQTPIRPPEPSPSPRPDLPYPTLPYLHTGGPTPARPPGKNVLR
ncbi:hypothetical protein K505DRAFT_324605 [Melanomma pulvis-pyrius CBS 109.77]|uniref:Uncharacterized protein n=1 Tax=Melanomma pulvis-pyrius CBS 109.77 TaxID=1314802 RepID=A0A6A6XDZ6_9PLEO|nr:hypothetical protein K505DRAFT_324605 [Melanomma pulvis-pyrius CBS 109.77]